MVEPSKFGRYEILSELGRGGMGVVYLAHDPSFAREVALKVLPRELLHDPSFRARFEREARMIAALEHPAIVPVHDHGEEDGQPYLVMRLMRGGSLADRLRQGALPLPEAARILSALAPALDRAHARGIIHRDLKPSNILFDDDGNPYLADFGLARLTEPNAVLSVTGLMGTPAYMSPEQARGEKDLDGRSDLYALGVIVFQMLTGQLPYNADTPIGMAVRHISDPVPRPHDFQPELPASVDAIIQRAMAKQRTERYPTAVHLAAELATLPGSSRSAAATHTLAPNPTELQRPVASQAGARGVMAPTQRLATDSDALLRTQLEGMLAQPTGRGGRRLGLAGSLVLLGLVPLGLLVAAVSLYTLWVIARSGNPTPAATSSLAQVTLSVSPTPPAPPSATPTRQPTAVATSAPLVEPATAANAALATWNEGSCVSSVAFSPDGQTLASGSADALVWLWDVGSGEQRTALESHTHWVRSVVFSPDGLTLASGSDDQSIWLWDVASAQPLHTLAGHVRQVTSAAFSPDGSTLVSAGFDKTVRLWDVASGQQLALLQGHTNWIRSVAFSPDGDLVASAGDDRTIRLWDVASGEMLRLLQGHLDWVRSVTFSPDGRTLASGSDDKTIRLWDVASGELLRVLEGHTESVASVAFSPDGRTLASGSFDGTVKLWDVATGQPLDTHKGHTDPVYSVAFSPDGRTLASGSCDATIRLWQVPVP
jgi:eukaryotic-like serine/threonine-protein kinase